MEYIALDSHKEYSFVSVEAVDGARMCEARIDHSQGAIHKFLERWHPGSPVAVETIDNWYWIVSEIEQAGMVPRLVNARQAKLMLASANKTDRLYAQGINRLQRSGTLPTVWIAPGELRDQRELFRTRMVEEDFRHGVVLDTWMSILWAANLSLVAQIVGNIVLSAYRPARAYLCETERPSFVRLSSWV